MKYSYEFKIKCIEAYKGIGTIEIPKNVKRRNFMIQVRYWVRTYDENGPDALKHDDQNKIWTAEEKYRIVAEVLAGKSLKSTAIAHGINSGLLYQWVRKYKLEGYNGLVVKPRGRRPKETPMSKIETKPEPLKPSEREELILLRERTKAMEAEIVAIKKERALRLERWEKALKAKKRKSSKNSDPKDMN